MSAGGGAPPRVTAHFRHPFEYLFVLALQPLIHFLQQRRVIFTHHIHLVAGGAGEWRFVGNAEHAGLFALVIVAFNQIGHHHIGRFLPQRLQVIDIVLHADNLRLLDVLIDKALVCAARVDDHFHVRAVNFFQRTEPRGGLAVG